MDKVAIVILNYNGAGYLQQFLPTVVAKSANARIIVADNCSSDNSLEVLNNEFPQVETIILSENYGYAGGYNKALAQVESEYYLLLNSDVEVTDGWIEPLVEFLDKSPNTAAVQPILLDYNKKDHFEYAGAAGGLVDNWGYPYCRGRILDTLEQYSGQYEDSSNLGWCTGACFLIRSETFHKMKGFDADFFAHMEEIDLCWRIANSGMSLACINTSKVYHVGGGTLNKTSPFKTYLNFRNNLSMMTKNMPYGKLWYVLPLRIVLDWLASIKFWKDQSFAHLVQILKAHLHFFKRIPRLIRSRSNQIDTHYQKGNILLSYYLKGQKTFNNTK